MSSAAEWWLCMANWGRLFPSLQRLQMANILNFKLHPAGRWTHWQWLMDRQLLYLNVNVSIYHVQWLSSVFICTTYNVISKWVVLTQSYVTYKAHYHSHGGTKSIQYYSMKKKKKQSCFARFKMTLSIYFRNVGKSIINCQPCCPLQFKADKIIKLKDKKYVAIFYPLFCDLWFYPLSLHTY